MRSQTVTAQNESVPGLDVAMLQIEFRVLENADCARNDIATRPVFGVRLAQNALIDQFLGFTMVAGDLTDDAPAHPVDAAIAGPQAGKMPPRDQQDDNGCANHLKAARIGNPANGEIGLDHAVRARLQHRCGACRWWQLPQYIDDHGAREPSGLVAAHAVGDRPEPDLRTRQEIVLVLRPDFADMRLAGGIKQRVSRLRHCASAFRVCEGEKSPVSMPA